MPGYVLLLSRCDGLLAGALLAWAWRRGAITPGVTRALWGAAGSALLVLVVGGLVSPDPGTPIGRWPVLAAARPVIGYTLNVVIAAAIVAAAATTAPRVLTWPILRTFGRYSYGLYVLHPFTVRPLHALWQDAAAWRTGVGAPVAVVVWATLFLAASWALAFASWHLLERPALSLKRFARPAPAPRPMPDVRLGSAEA